jgi:hypothetical protein
MVRKNDLSFFYRVFLDKKRRTISFAKTGSGHTHVKKGAAAAAVFVFAVNADGTTMNVGNKLRDRPSIALHSHYNSGSAMIAALSEDNA